MNWIALALLAPLLFSISTFIDKFLVSKYFKSSSRALVVYVGLVGIPVFIAIAIFRPEVLKINLFSALFILINSFLLIGYLFPYYTAIRKADASAVIPIFQIIPVFNFILAFLILKETLSIDQIIAAGVVILGGLGISINFNKGIKLRKEVLGLMLLACLFISVNTTMFKFFAIDFNFWTVSFWQYIGFFVFSMFLLLFRNFRKDLIESFRKNKKAIIGLNGLNEVIYLAGTIIFTYSILRAPLAIVSVINGLGPVFVFAIGLLLSVLSPKLIKEDLRINVIIQKIIFIIIIFIGGYFLSRSIA